MFKLINRCSSWQFETFYIYTLGIHVRRLGRNIRQQTLFLDILDQFYLGPRIKDLGSIFGMSVNEAGLEILVRSS